MNKSEESKLLLELHKVALKLEELPEDEREEARASLLERMLRDSGLYKLTAEEANKVKEAWENLLNRSPEELLRVSELMRQDQEHFDQVQHHLEVRNQMSRVSQGH
jgi:hypothetical protein